LPTCLFVSDFSKKYSLSIVHFVKLWSKKCILMPHQPSREQCSFQELHDNRGVRTTCLIPEPFTISSFSYHSRHRWSHHRFAAEDETLQGIKSLLLLDKLESSQRWEFRLTSAMISLMIIAHTLSRFIAYQHANLVRSCPTDLTYLACDR
jgi:hypothetical protein